MNRGKIADKADKPELFESAQNILRPIPEIYITRDKLFSLISGNLDKEYIDVAEIIYENLNI